MLIDKIGQIGHLDDLYCQIFEMLFQFGLTKTTV